MQLYFLQVSPVLAGGYGVLQAGIFSKQNNKYKSEITVVEGLRTISGLPYRVGYKPHAN